MVYQRIEIAEVGAQQAEAFGSGFFAVELVRVAQVDQRMAHYERSVLDQSCLIDTRPLTATHKAIHQELVGSKQVLFCNLLPVSVRLCELSIEVIHECHGISKQRTVSS